MRLAVTLALLTYCMSGCATVKDATEDTGVPVKRETEIRPEGIYHKVEKGQTLWQIAKAYGVNISDLIAYNNIPDAAQIEENQLIYIPGAREVKDVAAVETEPSEREFGWPVKGRILKYYGARSGLHQSKGIRIDAYEGQTVQASRSGKVIFADYLSGYANTVILDHQDGYYSIYGNNSQLLVKVGEVVSKGAPLAKVGRTGEASFLHFEIRKDVTADNPLYYLPP